MRIDPPQWVPLLYPGNDPTNASALSTLAFHLSVAFHHQSLQALIVSLAKACPLPSLIWHGTKEWIDFLVGWNMLDDMHKRYNFHPIFLKHLSNILSNMLGNVIILLDKISFSFFSKTRYIWIFIWIKFLPLRLKTKTENNTPKKRC